MNILNLYLHIYKWLMVGICGSIVNFGDLFIFYQLCFIFVPVWLNICEPVANACCRVQINCEIVFVKPCDKQNIFLPILPSLL